MDAVDVELACEELPVRVTELTDAMLTVPLAARMAMELSNDAVGEEIAVGREEVSRLVLLWAFEELVSATIESLVCADDWAEEVVLAATCPWVEYPATSPAKVFEAVTYTTE